jgi:8-oxo-dGTP diphosphatase
MQRGQLKEIRYWAAEVMSGSGDLEHEIDELAWLTPAQAQVRFTYVRDAQQLEAVVDADRAGTLQTWPLVVVRHADSVSRSKWSKPDPERPLDRSGRRQAKCLVPILAAYGVQRVITSPSVRCFTTVQPYAAAAGITVKTKSGLSEETFKDRPEKAARNLDRLVERGEPSALCTHRPVLPTVLERLRKLTGAASPGSALLGDAIDGGMAKGEALVCQIAGRGADAQVVSVERHTAG